MLDDTTNDDGAPLCPNDGTRCVVAVDNLASWRCPTCGSDVLA
jgi:hypothetical protein